MGQEWSEERVVHGNRYRWNFKWNCLEKYHEVSVRWEHSVFTAFVLPMLSGEPFNGIDGNRDRAEALHAAFAPLIAQHAKEQHTRIDANARDLVNDLFLNMAVGHPEEITAAWLMERHPQLSEEEAEEYRLFCKAKTIVFRGCYGDGSKHWPAWQAFKNEIRSL